MVKIAFWDNFLGERGTAVALYDYALYNKTLLNNESIIVYDTTSSGNVNSVIQKFKDNFNVYGVQNFNEVDKILQATKTDILYVIKSGEYDGKLSIHTKTVVHCVFSCAHPHGNVYSSIAPWIPYNDNKYPVVPHMINLPNHNRNLRKTLNISNDAIVFGRYGGYDQFDINYVHTIVYNIAKQYLNIYFIFLNTRPFCKVLPNIIHLDKIIDLDKKVEFINTCDAMLWARTDGETFGLSIGEFSSKNKPILCTEAGSLAHKHILKENAFWYDQNTLEKIILTFDKKEVLKKNWIGYKDYSPENVMNIFKKVYID
jgi:hypothetical protein